jgi:hypothetical protein
MKILNLEQGTDEWKKARMKMITGTKLDLVMGSNLDQLMLICELIAEEGTEQTKETRISAEMERGTAEEPFAIKHFSEKKKLKVEKVGMCISEEFPFLACSPDGLIKVKGEYKAGLEVKNPDTKTAVFYKLLNSVSIEDLALSNGKRPFLGIPADYKYQVLNYFLVIPTLEKMHFLTYDARFIAEDVKMSVVELERSHPEVQKELENIKETLLKFRERWLRYKNIVLPDNF